MADDIKPLEGKPGEPTGSGQPLEGSDIETEHQPDSLPEWAREKLRKANKEAADYRGKLRVIEEAQRKQEEDWAKEQGDYRKLWDGVQSELTELRALKDKATAYQSALTDTLAARLKAIPKDMQSLVPDFDDPVKTLAWLDRNASTFARRPAPNLDGGAQGASGGQGATASATPDDIRMAKLMNVPLDRWMKRKAETTQPVQREDIHKD